MVEFNAVLVSNESFDPLVFSEEPSYDDYYEILSCERIDVLVVGSGIQVVMDDSGAVKGRGLNALATLFAFMLGIQMPIFGPVLILGLGQEGQDLGLSEDQLDLVYGFWNSPPPADAQARLRSVIEAYPEVIPYLN